MSEQSNNTRLGDVAYVVRSVEGATAIARGNITNSKIETVDEIHNRLMAYDDIKRERDEARGLLRILAGLVAYGLGQSGEEWSLEAMRQATNAIQNAKFLEESK